MTIELHPVTADDWQTWRPVRLAALTDAPHAFGSTLADWADAPEHRWRTRLSIPGALDLLAREGSAVVGMASGVPDVDDDTRAEVISMWVDPAARGRGVAAALLEALARWAAEAGAAELRLSVVPENVVARRAYGRCGFVALDEPGDPLPGGRHEVLMRRDLAPERTLAAYEHGAEEYAERTDDHRAALVDDLLGLVPVGARVLELGSGPGRDALTLEAAGLVVDRTDGARAFVDALRAAGHTARLLDVRAHDYAPPGASGQGGPGDPGGAGDPGGQGGPVAPYDAVFANAVLLHVPRGDLVTVLDRARRAVRPGGVLAATLKRGDDAAWSSRKLDRPRHFTYWDEAGLTWAAEQAGWADVVVRETTRPGAEERWITITARRPEGTSTP